MLRRDLISVVEAAYRVESGASTWLAGLLDAAVRCANTPHGMVAFTYERDAEGSVRRVNAAAAGPFADELELLGVVREAGGAALMGKLAHRAGGSTASELLGVSREAMLAHPVLRVAGHPHGYEDFLQLNALDTDGAGCLLGTPLGRVTRLAPAEREGWGRVAAHITAALRVRRAMARGGNASLEHGADAVLSPSGRVEHAVGEARAPAARSALREALLSAERARGPLRRRDPDDALGVWQALVSGRWSLIERFDHDGRRYFVARRNEPHVADPRALDARERQVVAHAAMGCSNKLIAYSLGLATSTVALAVSRAVAKLGLRSRVELVQLARALGASAAVKPRGQGVASAAAGSITAPAR